MSRLTMELNAYSITRVSPNPDNMPTVIDTLYEKICLGETEKAEEIISKIRDNGETRTLLQHFAEEETILHAAIKFRAQKYIISELIDTCPELISDSRKCSELYRGQTALHMAITGGDIELVGMLLKKAHSQGPRTIETILNKRATGTRFENTVMMGELPLTVAALKLNTSMFDKLLEYNVNVVGRNSNGDNICHSLIKYSHLYPEKQPEIMLMYEHIAKVTISTNVLSGRLPSLRGSDLAKNNVHIWLMTNRNGLNPLQLAASLGQQPIFKFLMEMKGVYCYVNSEDGLFDVELYDVTDIDAISELDLKSPKVKPLPENHVNSATLMETTNKEYPAAEKEKKHTIPTLEMLFKSDPAIAFKFIHLSPLRYVINRKWVFYRWFYAIWGFLHMLFIVGYSVYAVRRSTIDQSDDNGNTVYDNRNKIGEEGFVTFYVALSLSFAVLYLLQEIVRMFKGRMPWNLIHVMNCYHNGPFRLVLVLFSITVFADFIWVLVDPLYGNFLLIISMVLGWWFIVFFLRGLRQFSFFTVMIQKILVGDMFRFSIIISMELVAFTTGIFIVFQGSTSPDETVHDYAKLMVLMFKLMFGFTSLDALFEARHPWFAVCLFTAFVLLTYVLMINSLIAMMSNTCSLVSQNRDIQYRVQQLSIILFFESILPGCCLRLVGKPKTCDWYDTEMECFVRRRRYFMEVRSLHEVTKSKSRHTPNPETMLETIFHTVRNISLPLKSVFESEKESSNVNNEPVEISRATLGSNTETVNHSSDRIPKSPKKHKKKRSKKPKSDKETVSSELIDIDKEADTENPQPNIYAEYNEGVFITPNSTTLEVHPFANTEED